jgi:predicted HicB family RNase H-like nuclease
MALKQYNMKFDKDLLQRLKKEAKAQKVSVSEMIRKVLNQYVVGQEIKREYEIEKR